MEELEEVTLDDSRLEWTTRVGMLASQSVRHKLTTFLRDNHDVFTWSLEDMTGIDALGIVHRLNVSPSSSPV